VPVISHSWHLHTSIYKLHTFPFRKRNKQVQPYSFIKKLKCATKYKKYKLRITTNMSFVNVHKNNTGKIKFFTVFFNWILGTFHIPPAAITQLFIVSTSVPYPVKQWLKTSRLSVKDPKQKSVMPHNPCLTTHQKENKSVLISSHNPELITRMKHMRCFHNFEEPVKQTLWLAVLPFSCHLAITDVFTQTLF